MKQFIHNNIIKKILDKSNIIELIGTKIKLIKKGENYYCICPFHHEKNPSFIINTKKKYFHCFGCNSHGNIIDFFMKYYKLNFIESIKKISTIIGIKIPYTYFDKIDHKKYYYKKQLYNIMYIVSQLYHMNITSKKCYTAILYLKKRNIKQKMINLFKIGFSSTECLLSYSNIYNQKKYFDNLIKSGIFHNNKYNKPYDRFNNRIIFPIRNQLGQITGFGGRTIINHNIKYLNSPKTNIFNKSKQLYGIYEMQLKYPQPKYILVVEGYFDVISLTQNHIKYVVSTMGTITTIFQIKILFRLTNNIIYCYDGDKPGIQAAWRTVKIILPYMTKNKNIKFIFLPKGEDPDSIINKEGTKNFKKRINHAINIIDFFFAQLCKKINLCYTHGKIALINLATPLINKIPNQLTRIYLKKMLNLKIGIINEYQFNQLIIKNPNNKSIVSLKQPKHVHILISLILQTPKLSKIIPFSIKEFKKINIPGLSLFMEIFTICKKYNSITTGHIFEFYRKNKKLNLIKQLALWNNMIDTKKKKIIFIDLIKKIYIIALEKKYNKLIIKDQTIGLNKKEQKILWKINKNLSKK